jgi:hypothetical protein
VRARPQLRSSAPTHKSLAGRSGLVCSSRCRGRLPSRPPGAARGAGRCRPGAPGLRAVMRACAGGHAAPGAHREGVFRRGAWRRCWRPRPGCGALPARSAGRQTLARRVSAPAGNTRDRQKTCPLIGQLNSDPGRFGLIFQHGDELAGAPVLGPLAVPVAGFQVWQAMPHCRPLVPRAARVLIAPFRRSRPRAQTKATQRGRRGVAQSHLAVRPQPGPIPLHRPAAPGPVRARPPPAPAADLH